MADRVQLEMEPDVNAIPRARRRLARIARQRLDEERAEDFELALSEVLTNAVLHGNARQPVKIELSCNSVVQVEIRNCADNYARTEPRRGPGGYGLKIVEQVADRWGVETDGFVRTWFCLDC